MARNLSIVPNIPIRQEHPGDVVPFVPEEAAKREKQIEAAVKLAKAVKDWESLDIAVAAQIEHQQNVVAWWAERVTPQHGVGRWRIKGPERGPLSREDAEKYLGIAHQTISKWTKRLANLEEYAEFLRGPSYRTAMGETLGTIRGTEGTGEFERYTPSDIIEMARAVMGSIDLDPASCELAQKTVKATDFFTVEDDGLNQPWHGNVWLNPPYHRKLLPAFINKLADEVAENRIKQAIVLTNNATDTDWFSKIVMLCRAICFTNGRVPFLGEDGITKLNPTQGQAIFYVGDGLEPFNNEFRKIGFVVEPVNVS